MLAKLIFAGLWLLVAGQGFWQRQIRAGLWVWWPVAMLIVPTWMIWIVRTINLDARTAVASGFLALLLLRPLDLRRPRLLLADYLIVLIILSVVVSHHLSGDLKLTVPLEAVRFWALPYLVGRFFFAASGELERALPWMARAILLICGIAIVESVARVNVYNTLLNIHFSVLESEEGFRWGLKRAHGPTEHPIALGMLLVLFVPWALEAYRKAGRGEHPFWWKALPILMFAAVFGTVSRAALLAYLMVIGAFVFFRFPVIRLVLFTSALFMAVTVYAYRQDAVDMLAKAEKGRQHQAMIMVEGQEVPYSGARHRQLLGRVYARAMDETGFFGYGPNIDFERLPVHPQTDPRFGSIDDHYVLFLLQYGHVGLALFVGLAVCAGGYLAGVAWNPSGPLSGLAGGLLGSLAAVTLMLKTVFLSQDFAPAWLFVVGLAACLHRLGQLEHRPPPGQSDPEPVGPLRDLNRRRPTALTSDRPPRRLPTR